MSERNEIEYSEKVPGADGNYQWPVRFDDQDGFLGVTQWDENGKVKDRVLLSPKQVRALLAFHRQWHPEKQKVAAHV